MTARVSRARIGQVFALIFAIGFFAAGLAGVLPALHTPVDSDAPQLTIDILYVKLHGVLAVNIVHTLIHWTFALLAVASLVGIISIRSYARGMAIVLAAFTIMGLLPNFKTVFGLWPLYGATIPFHAVEALVSGIVGWIILKDEPATEPLTQSAATH